MTRRELAFWMVLALAGLALGVVALRHLDPFAPEPWTISRDEAHAIAIDAIATLGGIEDDPWVAVDRLGDEPLAVRLFELRRTGRSADEIRRSRVAQAVSAWRVSFHERTETAGYWRARVLVSSDGDVLSVRRWWNEDEGEGGLESAAAITLAQQALTDRGVDLTNYGEPTVRTTEVGKRRDTIVRFEDHESIFGETFRQEIKYGLEVRFAGTELAGFLPYVDDPEVNQVRQRFQAMGLLQQAWVFLPILLLPIVAIPFVRRYHAGEVGITQGLRIAAVVLAGGLLAIGWTAKGVALGWNFGVLTKGQTTAVILVQFGVVFYVPMALLAFLSWSAGEALCRERRPQSLAAFDAFFRGQWRNATFARGIVRGLGAGVVLFGASMGLAALLTGLGVVPFGVGNGGPAWNSAQWFSLPLLGWGIASTLSMGLFSELLLNNWLARHFGRAVGVVGAASIATLATFPSYYSTPIWATLLIAFLTNLALIGVFLRWGLLSSLVARVLAGQLPMLLPLAMVDDLSISVQAVLMLVLFLVPLMVSAPSLFSGRELFYRWEDIPPHVRRIAERERQKVELETARNIQSSILPDLPPELYGVEMAHAYVPASEVGGDFYDVLALDDGRLAVAVGDVAGHGVSSGLVMSMAKSALAVQVTFDPEVQAVFRTLNRMVYQSARRRLLATLCYAVVDPVRREMFWASAGHLFPYKISVDGALTPLESIAYPLGVRGGMEVQTRRTNLDPGDLLFLFSDGVVEARREGSDDLWGFERLEQSLKRHARGGSATKLRDGVLADLRQFVGSEAPLEDDLTVLALRLPAA